MAFFSRYITHTKNHRTTKIKEITKKQQQRTKTEQNDEQITKKDERKSIEDGGTNFNLNKLCYYERNHLK